MFNVRVDTVYGIGLNFPKLKKEEAFDTLEWLLNTVKGLVKLAYIKLLEVICTPFHNRAPMHFILYYLFAGHWILLCFRSSWSY